MTIQIIQTIVDAWLLVVAVTLLVLVLVLFRRLYIQQTMPDEFKKAEDARGGRRCVKCHMCMTNAADGKCEDCRQKEVVNLQVAH